MAFFTQSELESAIRENICGELSAVNQYEKHILSTDNALVRKVLTDIRDEEKVHVGELLTLLLLINPEEVKFLEQGEKEVRSLESNT